jgi:hypothetical protein
MTDNTPLVAGDRVQISQPYIPPTGLASFVSIDTYVDDIFSELRQQIQSRGGDVRLLGAGNSPLFGQAAHWGPVPEGGDSDWGKPWQITQGEDPGELVLTIAVEIITEPVTGFAPWELGEDPDPFSFTNNLVPVVPVLAFTTAVLLIVFIAGVTAVAVNHDIQTTKRAAIVRLPANASAQDIQDVLNAEPFGNVDGALGGIKGILLAAVALVAVIALFPAIKATSTRVAA